MMRNLTSIVLVLAVVGCGGDDDGGGTPLTLAEFGAQLGAAQCHKAFECCTPAEISMFYAGNAFSDEAGCVEVYAHAWETIGALRQASIDAGNTVFDGSNASTCISALTDLTCAEFGSNHDALNGRCPAPFEGQLANGMACANDSECQTGYCEGENELGSMPTPGTCKDLPGEGDACTDFDCAQGLICDHDVCIAPKADGAACYSPDECASGGCNGATQTTQGTCGEQMLCNGV